MEGKTLDDVFRDIQEGIDRASCNDNDGDAWREVDSNGCFLRRSIEEAAKLIDKNSMPAFLQLANNAVSYGWCEGGEIFSKLAKELILMPKEQWSEYLDRLAYDLKKGGEKKYFGRGHSEKLAEISEKTEVSVVLQGTFSINYNSDNSAADWGYFPGRWSHSMRREEWLKWDIFDSFHEDNYRVVLDAFGLSGEDISLEKLRVTSPRELASMGRKNPKSCCVGDDRYALDVKN